MSSTSEASAFGKLSISDFFAEGRKLLKAMTSQLVEEAANYSDFVGDTFEVFWNPDNASYPAVLKSVDLELGILIVEFKDNDGQTVREFGVSPSAMGENLTRAKPKKRLMQKS